MERLKKTTKGSDKMAGFPGEIRSENLPYASLELTATPNRSFPFLGIKFLRFLLYSFLCLLATEWCAEAED
jgi:hypothetical protein